MFEGMVQGPGHGEGATVLGGDALLAQLRDVELLEGTLLVGSQIGETLLEGGGIDALYAELGTAVAEGEVTQADVADVVALGADAVHDEHSERVHVRGRDPIDGFGGQLVQVLLDVAVELI